MQRIEIGSNYMRSVYSRMLQALNINEGDFIISERTLRLEVELLPGQNTYNFFVVENKGSDRQLERKLNRNDGFVISHLGYNLTKQNEVAIPAQYANFPLYTYPDPNFFSGAAGGKNEYAALECSYNGELSLKTNNTEIIQQFPLFHTKYIPERGYTLPAAPQINPEHPQYGPSMDCRGLYPYAVNAILNGQDNNVATMTLGSGDLDLIDGAVDNAGAAVDTRNVAVLLLHGFEIAEAAQSGLRWGTF